LHAIAGQSTFIYLPVIAAAPPPLQCWERRLDDIVAARAAGGARSVYPHRTGATQRACLCIPDERATNQDKVGPVDYAAAAAAVNSALEGQRGERRAAKDGENVKGKLTCGPHLTRAKLAFHRVLDHK